MCGFLYAKLKEDIIPNFSLIFKEALSLMSYRGKDSIGFHCENNNFFGHTRLSIIDLTPQSNQPLITDKNVLLFKGEIYNYKSHAPDVRSDTLAILKLIENEIDISNKLAGMYGIIHYNKANQLTKVYRDFYGEKPIYYYLDNKIFIVSSTIKSIIHILGCTYKKKLKIDSLAVNDYLLCGYIREPSTIYENIKMLSSGHMLTFTNDWQFSIKNITSDILRNSIDSALHLEYSIKSTDVEPALLLSSGVDSTFLLNVVNSLSNNYKILTYKAPKSIYDESGAAQINIKKICKNKNIDVELIENSNDIANLYSTYPALLEQPTSDGINLFNILSVSRSNNNLKLILLGTGGDELYGGYNSFFNYEKVQKLRKFHYLRNLFPKKYKRFFRINSPKLELYSYYFLYRSSPELLACINHDIVNQLFANFVSEMQKYTLDEEVDVQHRIKIFESFDYMRNQLLRDSDNISLYCGYEARNPLLSTAAYKIKPDKKQWMKDYLKINYDIAFKQKKGFTFCESHHNLIYLLHEYINQLNTKYNIFGPNFTKKISMVNWNLPMITKIYILLSWLDYNQIEHHQMEALSSNPLLMAV